MIREDGVEKGGEVGGLDEPRVASKLAQQKSALKRDGQAASLPLDAPSARLTVPLRNWVFFLFAPEEIVYASDRPNP